MYTLRPISPDEFEPFHALTSLAFGEDVEEGALAYERALFEFERSIAAFAGDELAGTAGAYTFELTVPGRVAVPAAGVTWVGVKPTHRRRGILRTMMVHQLDDIAARGEPVAVLTASEAAIYGRFGYGVATYKATVDVPTRGTEFRPEPATGGTIQLVDKAEAAKLLPVIDADCRWNRPGFLLRPDRWWEPYLSDPKDFRDGATARYYAVHFAADGTADGYAAYRIKDTWDDRSTTPGNTVRAPEMRATDPEVEAALCRYLLDIDLIGTLCLGRRPLDDPLRFRLASENRYVTRDVTDWLWVRLVDIPAALSARRYGAEGSLRLGVHDPFRPANTGAYRLDGGPEGATCVRSGPDPGDADIVLGVDALGSAYLGGVSFTVLAGAGRVTATPAALERADAMFGSTPLPFCDLPF